MISITNPFSFDVPQGIILYQGPSRINREPIVVIATGFKRKSSNQKTGNEIQTFILPAKENPSSAWINGRDRCVCGDCKHSSIKNGGWNTCYVNIFQSPWNVWEAWKKGNYAKPTKLNLNLFRDKVVRIGSYGEPVAAPIEVWETILKYAKGWTSYTHQFKRKENAEYKKICMASCDTEEEYKLAKKLGWRTFRIRMQDGPLLKTEISCPASIESGHKTTCEKCQMCSGNLSGKTKDVSIIIHGRKWRCKRFVKIIKLRKQKKAYRQLLPIH